MDNKNKQSKLKQQELENKPRKKNEKAPQPKYMEKSTTSRLFYVLNNSQIKRTQRRIHSANAATDSYH